MTAKHIVVEGKVQGVGFRAHTQRCGLDLSLSGWVRNLKDGRVEILVFGTEESLQKFEKWVHQGPVGSFVAHVKSKVVENFQSPSDFIIKPDGGSLWQKS